MQLIQYGRRKHESGSATVNQIVVFLLVTRYRTQFVSVRPNVSCLWFWCGVCLYVQGWLFDECLSEWINPCCCCCCSVLGFLLPYNLVVKSATNNYSHCQFTPVRLGGSLGALSCGPMLLWPYYTTIWWSSLQQIIARVNSLRLGWVAVWVHCPLGQCYSGRTIN